MGDTKIEWSDKVWNPVTGCRKISPGCKHCYAETIAIRFWGDRKFTDVRMHEDRLAEPLKWRKPQRVFVNSMSDLFHEDVPFDFIDRVFAVMACSSRHTFQVLTKRPERAAEYLGGLGLSYGRLESAARSVGYTLRFEGIPTVPWPIPNIWIGTSVEDQERAQERIPWLQRCSAAVRFLSVEPLLGPVDLNHLWIPVEVKCWHCGHELNGEPGRCFCGLVHEPEIHWVIVGGESGAGARSCDVEWVREIVRQCREADVAVFVKQLGAKPFMGVKGFGPVIRDKKGGDWNEWPEDLRVREFPVRASAVA